MKQSNLIFFLSVCSSLLFTAPSFSQTKTNVVFILADDLGYGDLGSYGQKLIKTPNIDRLAANGIRFTQFYAGTSVCAPSRASLMTGQHTGHTPIRGNYEIKPERQLPLPDSTFTIAELFKNAGYTTGLFGKWGLGFPGSSGAPNNQGFDQFYGFNCQRQSHNFFPSHLWENTNRITLKNTLTQQEDYAPEFIQKKAMQFLTNNRDKPFLLFLTYTLPHAGLQLPAGDPVFESYKKKFNESPQPIATTWNGVGYQPQAYPKAAYAAMVSKLDQYVGEVVKKLKDLGLEKNTLIVFTSDNGPHREGGNQPEFFNSSGGFRGVKRDLYEGGIREPMIISWPAQIKKGAESNHIGAFWDFMPTFADLLKQEQPQNIDGISILPTLTAKVKQAQHASLYWEFHEDGGRQAVRMGNWKGVRLNVKKDKNAALQLFDLSKDPQETKDLSSAYPDVVKEMSNIMRNSRVENKDFPFQP